MDRAEFRRSVLLKHLVADAAAFESLQLQETAADAQPVTYSVKDGVAILTIDNPPVNSLHPTVLTGLLRLYEQALTDSCVTGVVVYGKGGTFVAGADIGVLKGALDTGKLSDFDELLAVEDKLAHSLESGVKPTVAAIDGNALGGGLEVAMMCNARVASPRSTLGLPELRLGIIPGFGGTQRLPRLVGLQAALRMMLQSKTMKAEEGKEAGLIDEVVESSQVLSRAVAMVKDIASGKIEKARALYRTDRLEAPEMAGAIFEFARNAIKAQPFKFPAACVDAIQAGVERGGVEGLKEEQRQFLFCLQQPTAKALMHVFFASRATAKVPGVTDAGVQPRPMKNFAVIGGGLMGSGIATSLLVNGAASVVLKEINQKLLDDGVGRVKVNLERLQKSKRVTAEQVASCMSRLKPTLTYDAFKTLDMVIEAAVENVDLKQNIFADLERVCSPTCVLATNTSTINLDLVGAKTRAADRIVGLHFFTPAHIMPLLEIVRTKTVSVQVLVDSLAVAKMLKKTPIVVGNCTGFAVNRIFFPYGMSADLLVMAGASPYQIDKALTGFGMGMGAFRMADLVGGDVLNFVNQNFKESYGDRVYVSPLRKVMTAANLLGEKTKRGFYDHADGKHVEWDGIEAVVAKARAEAGLPKVALSDSDLVLALLLPVVNEACRVVDEGIAVRPSDVDIATIFGYGFPAWRGGIMQWADSELGSRAVCAKLEEFASKFKSSLYTPSAYIKARAASNTPLSAPLGSGAGAAAAAAAPGKSDDDIVIVAAKRTALGRARRGGFKDTRPEDLLVAVLKDVLASTKLNPAIVGDVVVGTVLPKGEGAALDFRAACLLAGLPQEVPVRSVNRLCSSGLQAIADAAAAIRAGYCEVAIGAGVESMSMVPMGMDVTVNPKVIGTPLSDVYLPMGLTSENVAERYGVTRAEQDAFAAESHRRAAAAIKTGRFKEEIVPVHTQIKDDKTEAVKDVTIDTDEGVRASTTAEGLAKLPSAFKMNGTSTAGNSSQLTDGAAAAVVMTRRKARELGLPIKGIFRSYAVVGLDPSVMGIGPAFAIPKAVEAAGLTLKDIDLYEVNEAFASQAVYCVKKLGLDTNKVNVNGGAIALGHPLGCTGARQTSTLLHEMARRNSKYGVVSMCIGTGMGAAAVFERE